MNAKKLVVIVVMAVLGFLAGCAKPTPPTSTNDIQMMQRLQGKWMLTFKNGDFVTLTIEGQKINMYSSVYDVLSRLSPKMNNCIPKEYNGFATTYEISNGFANFVGRTGIHMRIWPKDDASLVGIWMTHPNRQHIFKRVPLGNQVATN